MKLSRRNFQLTSLVAAGRTSSVKMGDVGGGSLISPDGVALSRTVGPCTIKVQRRFLLTLAHLGSP